MGPSSAGATTPERGRRRLPPPLREWLLLEAAVAVSVAASSRSSSPAPAPAPAPAADNDENVDDESDDDCELADEHDDGANGGENTERDGWQVNDRVQFYFGPTLNMPAGYEAMRQHRSSSTRNGSCRWPSLTSSPQRCRRMVAPNTITRLALAMPITRIGP